MRISNGAFEAIIIVSKSINKALSENIINLEFSKKENYYGGGRGYICYGRKMMSWQLGDMGGGKYFN